MRLLIITLFWSSVVIMLGACNASSVTREALTIQSTTAIQPTSTVITPIPTFLYISTTDTVKPTSTTLNVETQTATVSTPVLPPSTLYEECSWGSPEAGQDWVLCSRIGDPITFVSKSNQVWQFSFKDYYEREIPFACTRLLYLPSDGEYAYFTLEKECIMAEPGFESAVSLFRMNLTNGNVNEIIKASHDFDKYEGHTYSMSISPTGRRLAYIDNKVHPLKLNILDLKTGEVRSFPLAEKYRGGGLYEWSEDGTKLVFELSSKRDDDYVISMVFVDLLKNDSMVTFLKDKDFIWFTTIVEFTDSGVKVTSLDDETFFYDINSGILSPINK